MAITKTNRATLLEAVKKFAPQLPENVVFLAGARKIKNDQMEIEFVQSRALNGRKASLFALFNEGDKRFNSGRTTMRVWLMVNLQGCKTLLAHEGIDFDEVQKQVLDCSNEEIVAILSQVSTVNVAGALQPVKIVCKETITVADLPKSIREVIEDEDANPEYKSRYILQTGDNDLIVDEFGNRIYRHFALSYGADEDVLVENKQLQSDYAKKLSQDTGSTSNSTEDILSKMITK